MLCLLLYIVNVLQSKHRNALILLLLLLKEWGGIQQLSNACLAASTRPHCRLRSYHWWWMGPAAWVGLWYCAGVGPLPPHRERITPETRVNHAYGAVALCVNPLRTGWRVNPVFCKKKFKSILLRRVPYLKVLASIFNLQNNI
jgi:hypothetical protein